MSAAGTYPPVESYCHPWESVKVLVRSVTIAFAPVLILPTITPITGPQARSGLRLAFSSMPQVGVLSTLEMGAVAAADCTGT